MANSYTNRLKKRLPAVGDENWDDEWHDNERIDDVVMGALLSANRVISGGSVSAGTGLNANYADMEVLVTGVTYTIVGGILGLTAAPVGAELGNWVYVTTGGTITVSTTPPAGDYVPLARVDTSDTAVIRIADLRPAAPVIWDLPDLLAEKADTHSLTGRNLIVNGSCQIDQENAGALITPASAAYPIDNCMFAASQASKLQSQQVTTALGSLGASHALRMSVLASYATLATDYFSHEFPVEGLNTAHLQWGTANAAAVSLQFVARASVGGTYSGSIRNAANNRSYPFSFVLAANTDTLIKIEAIPGCTDGTWVTTAAKTVAVVFDLGSGSNFKAAANTWAAGNYLGVTGSVNLVSQANGSTLDVSNIQLEKGPVCTQFERKLSDHVLRDCQRYLPVLSSPSWIHGVANTTTTSYFTIDYPVPPRITPTGIISSALSNFTLLNYTNLATGTPTALALSGSTAFNNAVLMATTTAGSPTLAAGNPCRMTGPGRIIFTGARI